LINKQPHLSKIFNILVISIGDQPMYMSLSVSKPKLTKFKRCASPISKNGNV